MYKISEVTDDAFQQMNLTLDSGKQLILTIQFIEQQYGWVVTELNYDNNSFVLNGLKIVNSGNMLNQFRNIIPFGLACQTAGNREPALLEDFTQGSSFLYILTQSECIEYADLIEKRTYSITNGVVSYIDGI